MGGYDQEWGGWEECLFQMDLVFVLRGANSSADNEEGGGSWRPPRKAEDLNTLLCNSQNIRAERDLKDNAIEFFPISILRVRKQANVFHKGPDRKYFSLCGP